MVLIVTIFAIVLVLFPTTRLVFKYATNQTLWFVTIFASLGMLLTPVHKTFYDRSYSLWSRIFFNDDTGYVTVIFTLYSTLITYGVIFFGLISLYYFYTDKRRMKIKRKPKNPPSRKVSKKRRTTKKRRKRS